MEPLSYAETAYDSRRPRPLAPALPMERRSPSAGARKLEPSPVACGEFLMLASYNNLQYAKENPNREHITTTPLQMGWMGFANPMAWAMRTKFITGFLGAICWFGGFVYLPIAAIIFANQGDVIATILYNLKISGIAVTVFLIPYFVLRYLLNHNKFTNKNNTTFDRRTGMVRMPLKGGKVWEVRFDELEPYQFETMSPNGVFYYHLLFGHRYSDSYMTSPIRHMDPWVLHVDWEYYQQFMDVSKPLPDMPVLEPERALDPTTIAWDARMGRPQGFWARTPSEAFKQLKIESWNAAEVFPWGATRKQAKAKGWKPSRYCEQTYWDREPPQEKKREHGHGGAPEPDAARGCDSPWFAMYTIVAPSFES